MNINTEMYQQGSGPHCYIDWCTLILPLHLGAPAHYLGTPNNTFQLNLFVNQIKSNPIKSL